MASHHGLITTAELAGALGQPELRLFDCTTYLEPTPAGSTVPYIAVPGKHTFEAGHIPGADFLDLQGEFSDQSTELRFMMPSTAQLAAAFGRHGLGTDSRVVLYSIGTPMWATRFWWMLRSLGFDNAAVLDGGFDKWKAEERAIETGAAKGYPPATFKAKPKPGFFVGKDEVLAAIADRSSVVVNALGPQFHKGLEPSRSGRLGRAPKNAGDADDRSEKPRRPGSSVQVVRPIVVVVGALFKLYTFGSGAICVRAAACWLTRDSPAITKSAATPKAIVSVSCRM